jgi:hypothetical protein
MKLAIGLPLSHGFPAPTEFWDSYEQLMLHVSSGQTNALLPEEKAIDQVNRIKGTLFPVDVCRNEIVAKFLEGTASYLLFLDADMTHPPDTVARLLKADKPVITGRYQMRRAPYHPVAYVKHRVKTGAHCYAPVHYGQGVFEIERGGGGCLLIRRDVAQAIYDRIGHNWFRYQRSPEPPHDYTVSEDFWFYQQAREAGFSCWLDWDCACDHLNIFGITADWNKSYLEANERELLTLSPEKRQAALDNMVVCGYPDGIQLPTGDRIPPYVVTAGER